MDAGAWTITNDDGSEAIVFRWYGNEAILSQEDWVELCEIIDKMRTGDKEAFSIEYLKIVNSPRVSMKRVPVGERITFAMLGIERRPAPPPFKTPVRRF